MKARAGVGRMMLATLGVLVVLGLVGGGCAVSGFNRARTLREGTKGAWAQVDNQLQRRYDLIPNLVETVKGYATHEKEIFENIAEARTKYFNAKTPDEKVAAANQVESVLSRLLMLKETYPDLKAQAGFLKLQDQLEGTENRLTVARMDYNNSVKTLNTYVQTFPGSLFAGWAGVQAAEYFETPKEAREAPKVKFDRG